MHKLVLALIAAAAGVALTWWLLDGVPDLPAPAPMARSESAAPPALSPAADIGRTSAAEPPAPAPETKLPPPPQVPMPEPAKPEAESPPTDLPADVPKPEEPVESEPIADAASADAETSEASEPSDEADADTIDVDRAADLFAEWMARQDTAGDGAEALPGVQNLRTFDQESPDPEWSQPTAEQIEATLRQWLDALPAQVRAHIEIIHVECRLTLCQILAADNDMASQSERAQAAQEWQQAIATLPQQPWWNELGFVDLVTSVNSDEASGYLLYQTYLRREVKPSA